MKLPPRTISLLAAAIFAGIPIAKLPTQPTPYPEDVDEIPGKGSIKIHPWCVLNRSSFSSQHGSSMDPRYFHADQLHLSDQGYAKFHQELQKMLEG